MSLSHSFYWFLQEWRDLEDEFATRKRVFVDEARNKLAQKFDNLRNEMTKRQEKELANLEVLYYTISIFHIFQISVNFKSV